MTISDPINFQRDKGELRKEVELSNGATFPSLRNNFTTRMENFGDHENHIDPILGHDDGSNALDLYSGGLAIKH